MGNLPMKLVPAIHPAIQEDEIVVEAAPSLCLVYARDIFQEVETVKEVHKHHALQMPTVHLSAFGYLSGTVFVLMFNSVEGFLASSYTSLMLDVVHCVIYSKMSL